MLALLAAFGVILACAVGAGELLRLAERSDGATGVDSSITTWVVAHRAGAPTTLAHALSTLGSQLFLAPLTAIATAVLVWRRRFVTAGMLVAAWGGAILLYNLTKHFVHRMRPPVRIWLTQVGHTTSFPSGHATQSMATFLALSFVVAIWLPRLSPGGRAVAVVLALGVGWSRVYLGVHWATDVVAGWLIAAAWITALAALGSRAYAIDWRRTPNRSSR